MDKREMYEELESEFRKSVTNTRKRYLRAKFILDHIDFSEDFPAKLSFGWCFMSARNIQWDPEGGDFEWKGHPKAIVLKLRLKNTWRHKEENREILAEIMKYFDCIFYDAVPEWKKQSHQTKYMPDTIYRGLGRIDGYRIIVELETPWPPVGCEIKHVPSMKTELVCQKIA